QRLLDRFLTEVAGRPAVLVGNSMGGMISVMQAATDPDTVAGLVLLDPALPRPRGVRPDPEVTRLFAALLLPRIGELALSWRRNRYTPEQIVADTIMRCTFDFDRVPAELLAAQAVVFRERSRQPDADRAFVGAARSVVYALLRPARLAQMVRTVRQPTLLVHGVADRLVPVGVARHVATQRPDWRVEILEGFGHLPQMEDAETTAQIISDWFALDGQDAVKAAYQVRGGDAVDIELGAPGTGSPAVDTGAQGGTHGSTRGEPGGGTDADSRLRHPSGPAAAPAPAGSGAGPGEEAHYEMGGEDEDEVSVIAPAIVRPEVAEIGHPPRGNSNGSVH
nr:alpha/beta hydrolase [Micromonospora sp. DSM 115978]